MAAGNHMRLLSLIIPAYNEVESIRRTLGEAIEYFDSRTMAFEIIVCADGEDGTREATRELAISSGREHQIKVFGSVERRGKGRGIRESVRDASGDLIGFADADNKTPITEFDKMLPFLDAGHEVVVGSRGLRESRVERSQPLYRRLGSKGFGLLMHACVGLNDIVDTQCGFKFFQAMVAKELFLRQQIDGYMFDVEVLFLARQQGHRITQVPVRWRDDGDSRLQLVSGNVRNVRDLLSIRWRHQRQTGPAAVSPRDCG
jgi:dolichyl-phosphate beta-glucosyltransferase